MALAGIPREGYDGKFVGHASVTEGNANKAEIMNDASGCIEIS